MPADARKPLRCAVYTRKSSEEGLEQAFNSLDAQREACEAYITSQRHEGWRIVDAAFDDGGFSGGTMERPALRALMEQIRQSKVDVVVVYKVDRLTRSLADFAKLVELFDSHGVSFVSVTQQFNTTTSMGRLTLNVLLSFAQFEREVAGERIRDKIAASKRKGMFMGGGVPLGYDLDDHKLVINEAEASVVRSIYHLYLELKCVRRLQAEVAKRDYRTKVRNSAAGQTGGQPLSRGHLYYILKNRTYLGEIAHKGQAYLGQHKAIIDRKLWEEVQSARIGNAKQRSERVHAKERSPLAGLIFDERGNRLTPSHTCRAGGVRYRYYVCQALLQHEPNKAGPIKRVPAEEIEAIVAKEICSFLSSPERLSEHFEWIAQDWRREVLVGAAQFGERMMARSAEDTLKALGRVIQKVVVGEARVQITIHPTSLLTVLEVDRASYGDQVIAPITLEVAVRVTRSGRQKSMIALDRDGAHQLQNDSMITAIARAIKWDREIRAGATLANLAKRDGVSTTYATRVMPLAFLAPDIVQAVYEGRQPLGLKVKALSAQLPIEWSEQRRLLGFSAP